MPDVVEKEITVYLCPRCARAGRGIAKLNGINLMGDKLCLECGWSGEMSKAQQYSYPCRIYKTVEMDVSVLMNMWDILRPEGTTKLGPTTQVPFFIVKDKKRFPCAADSWIGQALDFLVNKGYLPVAHYKLDADDDTTTS